MPARKSLLALVAVLIAVSAYFVFTNPTSFSVFGTCGDIVLKSEDCVGTDDKATCTYGGKSGINADCPSGSAYMLETPFRARFDDDEEFFGRLYVKHMNMVWGTNIQYGCDDFTGLNVCIPQDAGDEQILIEKGFIKKTNSYLYPSTSGFHEDVIKSISDYALAIVNLDFQDCDERTVGQWSYSGPAKITGGLIGVIIPQSAWKSFADNHPRISSKGTSYTELRSCEDVGTAGTIVFDFSRPLSEIFCNCPNNIIGECVDGSKEVTTYQCDSNTGFQCIQIKTTEGCQLTGEEEQPPITGEAVEEQPLIDQSYLIWFALMLLIIVIAISMILMLRRR